jgi:hypothetical protein
LFGYGFATAIGANHHIDSCGFNQVLPIYIWHVSYASRALSFVDLVMVAFFRDFCMLMMLPRQNRMILSCDIIWGAICLSIQALEKVCQNVYLLIPTFINYYILALIPCG